MSAIKIGDTFRYLDADVVVVAVGGPGDAFLVRDGEIGIRALTRADGVKLGWLPVTSGEHEAFRDLAEFLAIAEPTILTAPTNPSTGAVTDRAPAPVGAPTPDWDAMADAYGPVCAACEGDDDASHVVGCLWIAKRREALTHTLDRIPWEPNPLDLDRVVGFAADVEQYERPTVWLTPEQYTALGEPQQITVTIGAVR